MTYEIWNTLGVVVDLCVFTFGWTCLLLIFFKKKSIAKRLCGNDLGAAWVSTIMGTFLVLFDVVIDVTSPDKPLNAGGLMLSIVLGISAFGGTIYSIYWLGKKIRSYFPDEVED